jgi:hypothetical protein
VPQSPPIKINKQIDKQGLPKGGSVPFIPQVDKNKKGQPIIRKAPVQFGPKKGKKGYVDTKGRIWIKDKAHGKYPDHWDVQENGGRKGYIRVDSQGNILT